EHRGRRALVLGEHLGELAPGAQGGPEHPGDDGFLDHGSSSSTWSAARRPGAQRWPTIVPGPGPLQVRFRGRPGGGLSGAGDPPDLGRKLARGPGAAYRGPVSVKPGLSAEVELTVTEA